MESKKRQLVFLADCLPSDDSTAGSLLRNIITRLPEYWEVKMYVIRNPYLPLDRVGFIPNVQITMFAEPQSDWKGVLLPLVKWLGEKIARNEGKAISLQISRDLNSFSPEFFFVMPQTHIVAQVALSLSSVVKNCNKLVMMTDHHSWWSRTHGLSRREGRRFAEAWHSLFEKAEVRVLPSQRAQRLFTAELGRNAVLYPTFERKEKTTSHAAGVGDAIKIAFAGEDYAKQEIEIFLSGLATANNRIFDRPVEFHYFGKTTLNHKTFDYVNRGRIPAEELVEILSEFDFAFLPYPTDPEMALVSETSFPSKLTSYVAAGLPILYLGPVEGSAAWEYIYSTGIGGLATDFLREDQLFLSKDWSKALSQSYEDSFADSVFQASVNEMFALTEQFTSKREAGKNQKYISSVDVERNRFGTWQSAANSELLNFTRINTFSASRALRFLSSPVWVVSKGLGLIRKHGLRNALGVAKNLIRGIGRIVSRRNRP